MTSPGAPTFDAEGFALFAHSKRIQAELGMRAAADEVGVTTAQVFRVEHGQAVNIRAFLAFCDWLEVDPFAFLVDTATGERFAELPDREVSRETMPYVQHGPPTPEYGAWRRMIARCHSSNERVRRYYSGRGITVCDRWRLGEGGRPGFLLFVEDMGPHPGEGYSIDRINPDGNYEPGNCRWASVAEQNRNTRRNHFVTYRGRRMAVSEAVEVAAAGVSRHVAGARLKRGWSVEAAVETPTETRGHVRLPEAGRA
jgi:hypothetical protein